MSRPLVAVLVSFALAAAVIGAAVMAGDGPVELPRLDGEPSETEVATTTRAGSAPTTATAGPARATGQSPWDEAVLVVTVRNRAAPERNVTGAVREALAYWHDHADYADYPARFVVRDEPRPDVVFWYNESIECPDHDDAVGCAPLLESGARVDPPIAVQLRYAPGDNRRQVRNTAIHEFGHVLGVTHCEPPHWVMASTCEEPIPDAPDASERDLAWREGTLAVHVDLANVSADEREATRDQVDHALEYLAADPEGALPAPVRFVRVEDRFDADVSVTFLAEQGCPEGTVVCYVSHGRDADGDGRMEYHTRGEVAVAPGSDVPARGWYVGRALAHQVSPANVPTVFEDASYRERRSRWWE